MTETDSWYCTAQRSKRVKQNALRTIHEEKVEESGSTEEARELKKD